MLDELFDMLKTEGSAQVIRLLTLALVAVCGVAGAMVKYEINDVFDKVKIIDGRTEVLTATAAEAKSLAAEAKNATEQARAETTARFDNLEKAIQNETLVQTKTELKIYSLSIRIGCLERKVICPQTMEQ